MSRHEPNEPDDDGLIREAGEVLDAGVQAYDAETRHRLRHARELALSQVPLPWWRQARMWLGAGALAAPLAVAWLVLLAPVEAPDTPEAALPELVAMAGDSDFYADLEFYEWLAAQDP